ncbi:ATP synthase F1 subunit delta [Melioribacteraceae bacterium 4301-Me]|uniref:ATP synthase F1 subunit delta n=1 Tax=Pyranulibacter aquaticus TaxID=3163344 RepID=UPI00359A8E07
MGSFRIADRYAKSLMKLADEKKSLAVISDDADLIYNTLKSSRDLRVALKSPVVNQITKANILSEIFKDKVSTDSLNFMRFIVDKNREEFLFDIFARFTELRDARMGILRAKVTSAVELSESIKMEIKTRIENFTKKAVNLDFDVDKNLIGGFWIKINDTIYDASIIHRLSLLRKAFLEQIIVTNN